ncbi:MAG: hypothetical protein AAF914_00450 [Pseudomonadota bacterium]
MKTITAAARQATLIFAVNIDRLLVPLTIIGALTIAGWLFSYATVH